MTPYDPITLFTPHWNSPETTDIQKANVCIYVSVYLHLFVCATKLIGIQRKKIEKMGEI